jgi:hypothetical protein
LETSMHDRRPVLIRSAMRHCGGRIRRGSCHPSPSTQLPPGFAIASTSPLL